MVIHHYVHLVGIDESEGEIAGRLDKMSAQLDELTKAVAAERTVVDSVSVLVTTLLAQIEAAKNDPAQVQAIIDEVRSQTQELTDVTVTPPVVS